MSSRPSRKMSPALTSMVFTRSGLRGSVSSSLHFRAADAFVDKSQFLHFGGIEKISPVEENRMGEFAVGAFEIELLEFGPFGGDDQGVAAARDVVHVIYVGHVFEDGFGLFHGL